MNIEIARPLLLILIPFIVVGLIYSGKFLRMKNKKKKLRYIVMRAFVMSLLVLALAGISLKWTSEETTTVFLVDMSDSAKNNQKDIEKYLRDMIKDIPDKNTVGIIVFGADSTIEQFVTNKEIFDEITTKPITTATNIEQAISTGLTLYPEGAAKRMVLITDGAQNYGNMDNMTSALIAAKVQLKVVKLESSFGKEVYVSDVTIPDIIHVDDKFSVTANIKSNIATNAIVSLYSGRTLKSQENVKLQVGDNQFVFNDVGDEGGLKSYRVVVDAEDDNIGVNNEYSAFTQIEAKPKVLLVEGSAGLGDQFAAMLDANSMLYDKVTPSGVPTTIADFNEYKAIITIDVHYDDMKKGFAKNLDTYVKDYAGGYICIGGENSYALGGYKDTELEAMLPVFMDLQGEKEIPKMAMVMVIDHSGSMTTPSSDNSNVTGLDLAKEAAVSGVENLRKTDEVGVLVFDDGFQWTVPIEEADDIDSITDSISTIGYGGGTSICPALREAEERLAESDAQIKHIILLTDGQDTFRDYDEIIEDINTNGITLSSVAVGEGADVDLMKGLAESCGGRYYYTDINSGIPRIFAQEVFLSVKSYLINEEFTPIIVGDSPITDEILANGYPNLLGYIAATPKDTAKVILESDKGDPILSTWQYGLGKTVAWNSDGTNQWTSMWANWENYSAFWKNVIDYTISDTSLGNDTLEVSQNGTSAVITYGTADYDENTKITGLCTTEGGEQIEFELDPMSPGQYEGSIDLEELGVYSINISNSNGNEIVKTVNTATAMQYSPEYRFDTDTSVLDSFVTTAQGEVITFNDKIYNDKIENIRARKNLAFWLIMTALFIFMADIVMRRFQIDYVEGMTKIIKKKTVEIEENSKIKQTEKKRKEQQKNSEKITNTQEIKSKNIGQNESPKKEMQREDSSVLNNTDNVSLKGNKVEPVMVDKKIDEKKNKKTVQTIDTASLLKKRDDRQ